MKKTFKKKIFILLLLILPGINLSYSQVKIGVAIPLMTNSSDASEKKTGEQMLRGINDALEEYKKNKPAITVTITAEDTKKDQSATLDILNRFGSDNTVIAVLGPIFSSELINNAGAAVFHKMPVISPTATVNFLAQNNPYVFQLNPTYDIRGRVMAKFAMKEMGMKNFIILSEDTYGKNYAESFKNEVEKNKGTIEGTEFYIKDSFPLTAQFESIKSTIFSKDKFIDFGNLTANQSDKLKKSVLRFSNFDSLFTEKLIVSIYKLFGKNADTVMDSLKIYPSPVLSNSGSIIPGYIDALYITVSNHNDISKICEEYFSSGINLPLLGSSDWNNEKTLTDNKKFIRELYFDSDFYLADKDDKTGLSESDIRNYYFGYDGMKLILDKISEKNITREDINESLENLRNYTAMHNRIDMKERTNQNLQIMSFRDGKLSKLRDYETE